MNAGMCCDNGQFCADDESRVFEPYILVEDRSGYGAEKADRYTASIEVSGKVTEKLSVQAKVSSSFDGYFKTDAEGVLGLLYAF